ncbi:hypothetical protein N5W20_06065 [Candidatus Kirkpatrickella diaphorinae]|uniref:Na+/solute symporter n=1 Tax=Candidatus Kirkpatrickella diaphorinae TaxID=2984322 RepID=A0ABY6GH01_9PROT|nr:hypothetical protein [Candidatus Kirkpatrickella diaphorinae]UYH50685.1 hypothetical protein N5W20_06065 [Candidatus Kirkpatrickella diaphorinae]
MLITIGVAASFGLIALLLALSGARSGQNASRFFAAAGQFGLVLYAVLAIGDTYSIGTLLGFPGSIYADGGFAALWFCGYIMLAFPIATMLYPRLWRIGQECGAATLTDLFRHRFNDRRLDLLLAALLFLCFIPLGTSQFIGLQSAFNLLAGPDAPRGVMAALAFSGLLSFLIAAGQGMGGAARAAILKDVLVISAIVMVAGAALMAGAGWLSPSHQGVTAPPEVFHAFTPSVSGDLFILTTIAVQASAFCISPPTLAAIFSARHVETVRRGQIWMPLYMLLFPLLGIVAIYGHNHHIAAARPDDIFLATAQALLPAWMMGFVLAGTCLAAFVILASCSITLGGVVARSVMLEKIVRQQIRIGLATIAAYLTLSLIGALTARHLLISLNTMFYLGLAQILPGVLAIIFKWRVSSVDLIRGMVGGLASGCVLRFGGFNLYGLNPAFMAVIINLCLCCWAAGRKNK